MQIVVEPTFIQSDEGYFLGERIYHIDFDHEDDDRVRAEWIHAAIERGFHAVFRWRDSSE